MEHLFRRDVEVVRRFVEHLWKEGGPREGTMGPPARKLRGQGSWALHVSRAPPNARKVMQ